MLVMLASTLYPEYTMTRSTFYYLVGEWKDGGKYMNALGRRCSWRRAQDVANAAREAGALWAVVFDRDGLFMFTVTPWEHEGFDRERDVVREAAAFRELSLSVACRE